MSNQVNQQKWVKNGMGRKLYSNGFKGSQAREAVQETQQSTIEEGGVVLVGVVTGLWMTINSRNL
jgi:hypothetical protein